MRLYLSFLTLVLAGTLPACASAARPVAVTVVAREPEAFFGQAIELCGDLSQLYSGGFDRARTGYALHSPGGEGSRIHGRIGVFVPRQPWLDSHIGTAICVTGSIAHASGMTLAQLAQERGRYYTDSAVDDQWHFVATGVTSNRSRKPEETIAPPSR